MSSECDERFDLRPEAQSFARKWGLQDEISREDAGTWPYFLMAYWFPDKDLPPNLVSGSQLLQRWDTIVEILRDKLPFKLPIYLCRRIEDESLLECSAKKWPELLLGKGESLEQINDEFSSSIHDDVTPGETRRRARNIWFLIVQYWVFKLDEVEFFEKLHPSICGEQTSRRVVNWMTEHELRERWNVSLRKLEECFSDRELAAYYLSYDSGITRASEDFIRLGSIAPFANIGLHRCLFRLEDVEVFERKRKNRAFLGLKSDSPYETDKETFFNYRDAVKGKDRATPDAEIIEQFRKNAWLFDVNKKYEPETYQRWIAEKEKRGPGMPKGVKRRPKSTKQK